MIVLLLLHMCYLSFDHAMMINKLFTVGQPFSECVTINFFPLFILYIVCDCAIVGVVVPIFDHTGVCNCYFSVF